MPKLPPIDMSRGDPIEPLTAIVNHAFREARREVSRYIFNNPSSIDADESYRRAMSSVSAYLKRKGIKPPGWSGVPFGQVLLTGGGTTEGFELVMRHLGEDVRKACERGRRKIKPVILMPTPTYGYFFEQPKRHGVEVVQLPLDLSRGGALSPRELHDAITEINKSGRRVVAFYMPNPHNPLGYVRGEDETRALARIIQYHNERYNEQERSWVKRGGVRPVVADDKISAIFGTLYKRHEWKGPASRIRIIDDMVYDGLEYGERKAFSFAQIEECYNDTFLLFGLSKVGLPGVRAGIVVGGADDIWSLMHMQRATSYFPNTLAMKAMEAFCADEEPFRAWRENHLARQREIYRFNSLFMKALVNGLADTGARDEDVKKMVNLLVRHTKCSRAHAFERLDAGIKHARIITSPEAGFFHLLDLSALKEMHVNSDYTLHDRFLQSVPVFERQDGRSDKDRTGDVLEYFNLRLVPSEWGGSGRDEMLWRISFAEKPKTIIEFADRLKDVMSVFKPAQDTKPGLKRAVSLP